jgi:hypothetical protein
MISRKILHGLSTQPDEKCSRVIDRLLLLHCAESRIKNAGNFRLAKQ